MLGNIFRRFGNAVNNASDKREALSDLAYPDKSSLAGVSETRAKKIAAVYSCVTLIAGALSRLEWRMEDPMLQRLMNKAPCQSLSGSDLRRWVMEHVLLRGNCVLFIIRDLRTYQPVGLLPVPDGYWQVEVVQSGAAIGRLRYQFKGIKLNGEPLVADQDDILHFHTSFFDIQTGIGASPLQTGASGAAALEAAMAEYNAGFFDRDSTAQFVFSREGKWDEDQTNEFKREWLARYSGKGKRGVPIVVGPTAKLTQLSITARDSQLIESREFQIADIARAYRVPSFLLNMEQKASSWGSGISQINSSFLHFTLQPHVTHMQSEVSRKFFPDDDRMATLDTAPLTRGTQMERYQSYAASIGAGWDTVNEVRKLEGREPFPEEKYDRPSGAGVQNMDQLRRMIEADTAAAAA